MHDLLSTTASQQQLSSAQTAVPAPPHAMSIQVSHAHISARNPKEHAASAWGIACVPRSHHAMQLMPMGMHLLINPHKWLPAIISSMDIDLPSTRRTDTYTDYASLRENC